MDIEVVLQLLLHFHLVVLTEEAAASPCTKVGWLGGSEVVLRSQISFTVLHYNILQLTICSCFCVLMFNGLWRL